MPGYLFGLVNRTERGPKPKLSWRQLYLFDWPFLFFLCNNGKKNLGFATISPSIFPISDSRCKSHDGGWAAMVRGNHAVVHLAEVHYRYWLCPRFSVRCAHSITWG